jgi:hypothetical protein
MSEGNDFQQKIIDALQTIIEKLTIQTDELREALNIVCQEVKSGTSLEHETSELIPLSQVESKPNSPVESLPNSPPPLPPPALSSPPAAGDPDSKPQLDKQENDN